MRAMEARIPRQRKRANPTAETIPYIVQSFARLRHKLQQCSRRTPDVGGAPPVHVSIT